MEYCILGRTGLRVSVAGLGCGGPSRLGLKDNKTEKEASALVRQALEIGVNFIDTAEAYGTESIVGEALEGFPREQLVISTKKAPPSSDRSDPAGELRKAVEQSLRRLKTDYVDIFHLHGVEPGQYTNALETLYPALEKMRAEGKIRFVGITEAFVPDPDHCMLQQALKDNCWDVVMVGFNMLNQGARSAVFPGAIENNVGTLVMFAVRRALSQTARLKEIWADLKQKGLIGPKWRDGDDPLEFLTHDRIASTIPEAAYRYCRHQPGVHVVLTGTGNPEHLKANIDSILKPPLPEPVLERIREIFGGLSCLTGN